MRLHAVILAGGRGERFWPLSRRSRPKQFLPLLGDGSMLGHTLERLRGLVEPRHPWIVTARDLKKEAERFGAFREKPAAKRAEGWVAGGRHLWKGGLFVFPPRLMIEEIRAHEPRIAELLARVPRHTDLSATAALEGYYRAAPSISIDYA